MINSYDAMWPEYKSMSDHVTKANQIRVRVRTNDIPRWNRVLLKSQKKSNSALLEWMLQLAEAKLDLDPEESRQEWEEALQKKTDCFDAEEDKEEESDNDESKLSKRRRSGGDRDAGNRNIPDSTESNNSENERLSNGPDNHIHETLNTSKNLWLFETSTEQQDDACGPVRETGAANSSRRDSERGKNRAAEEQISTERLSSVPRMVEEQITVEKKGSNAPIRKRFRLRVSSSTTSPSEVVSEGAPLVFREPPKFRRKLEKAVSRVSSPSQPMNLRSRERNTTTSTTTTPVPGSLKPRRNNKSKVSTITPVENRPKEKTVEVQQNSDENPTSPATDKPARLTKRTARKREVKGQQGGPFVCSHCPRVFNNATSHSRHEKAHTKQTEYICSYCNKKFSTGGSLWHHKKSQHEEKHLKCSHCDERFAVERFLKLHMRRHTGEKPYKCKTCDAQFALASTLRNHQATHSALKPFLCDTCGVSFRRKDNLEHHIERRHKRSRDYSCNLCHKSFSVQSTLDNHKIHHENKEHGLKPYKCDLCAKHFTTPNGLKSHMSLHKMKKDHVCETCGKVFKMRYYLTKHQAIHLKVKPFLCNVCDRRFAQKSNLDIHMRTHTGVKPYTCNLCGKSFSHNVSLKGHTSTCHAETGSSAATRTKSTKTGNESNPSSYFGKEPSRKKTKKNKAITQEPGNQVPLVEVTNQNFNNEQLNLHANTEIANQSDNREGEEDMIETDPLAGRGPLETPAEVAKEAIHDALKDNLVIDEQPAPHYSHAENQSLPPGFHNVMSGSCPVSNLRSSVIGIEQEVPYNIQAMMTGSHISEKGQYVVLPSPSMGRETPQPLARPEHSMSHINNVETPSSPPIHLGHPIQSDLRPGYPGMTHQVLHPGNIGAYTRHVHPLLPPSPLTQQTGNASPIIHQDDNLMQRTAEVHPSVDQPRLSQSLANPSPSGNLSPQPIIPQPDPVSPLPSNLQVENVFHQTQPSYSQNINFIPTFHPQPQPLTISAQATSLLPNMIRKEQPLLVENLAMIPFRAIAQETAAQMVQDPRFNPQNGNLTSNKPVHLPLRYIEYSQTPVQTSQSARPESQPPLAATAHFSKVQSNLPSRMTSALQQSFAYTTSFASVGNLEQVRSASSYSSAQAQRSPGFVNVTQIDNVKDVSDEVLGVEGGWKQPETRWDSSHLHQIPGTAQGNISQQIHRLSDFIPRGMIPVHSTASSGSEQPVWSSPNS